MYIPLQFIDTCQLVVLVQKFYRVFESIIRNKLHAMNRDSHFKNLSYIGNLLTVQS